MTTNDKANLLLLFERPTEPAFIPKGDNNVIFDVPNDYFSEEYKPFNSQIVSKFGEDNPIHVKVENIVLPDLSFAMELGRREPFSLFLPWHRRLAGRLIEVLVGMRNVKELTSVALYCRDNINPYLFIYAYSVALLHRPDTADIELPPLSEIFPDKFIGGGVKNRIQETISIKDPEDRVPLEIPRDYTANDLEEEHRVAYWREDLGINLHHWHWHLVYPFNAPRNIVAKDRRGELFFYMHQQIIARYDCERLSNRLGLVVPLDNFRQPLKEGYFPKLDSLTASRNYASRHSNANLSDVNRVADQITVTITQMERWQARIYDAIHTGSVLNTRNERVPLTEMGGIDVLGDLVEASILTVNSNYYGDMHNLAHVIVGVAHDPDNRHLEAWGPLADPSTAMRDPAFYRIHKMVDNIFQEHKNTLPRYTVAQLDFSKVTMTGLEVNVTGPRPAPKNELSTYWQQDDVDLSRGLDFSPRGAVLARFTHLQHAPFTYKITVNNAGAARQGTVRIFLAPKFDEKGTPMLYRTQKVLFIEMDKFTISLKPGANNIERRSDESSVTIPFERTFRDLGGTGPADGTAAQQQFNFCGCGWPDHMLLPMGNAAGMVFQLFAMVSDFADDRINQSTEGACADAASFCGIKDKLYPDKRSMGYPFDRQPRDRADTLTQFLTPNMRVQDVVIRFSDRTETPQRRQTRPPPAARPAAGGGSRPQQRPPTNRPNRPK